MLSGHCDRYYVSAYISLSGLLDFLTIRLRVFPFRLLHPCILAGSDADADIRSMAGWLPAQGMTSVRENYTGFNHFVDVLRHLALPLLVLSTRYIAINSRMTHASMLEVLREGSLTTARSKGLNEKGVNTRHAFRNALLPVVTVIGVNFRVCYSPISACRDRIQLARGRASDV